MDSNYIITSNGSFISDHELYHHGILGMKWGIRRYQNSDGSLTAAGRKRYTNPDGTLNKKGQKYYAKESERLKNERKRLIAQKHTAEKLSKLDARRKINEDLKNQLNPKKENKSKPETSKKKKISEMTDEELNAAINRARIEDTYRQLRPEPVSEKSKFMKRMFNEVVVPGAVNAGKATLQKMVDKAMKDNIDPNSYEALKKTYDKLKIQKDIEKLKKGEDPDSKPMSWDDKLKKQQYDANERKYAKEQADEAARKAKQEAQQAKTDMNNSSKENKASNSSGYSGSKSDTASKVWERMNSSQKAQNDFVKNNRKKQKAYDFDYTTAKSGTVEGTGTSFNKKTDKSDSNNANRSTIDMERGSDGVYRYRSTPVTDLVTTQNTSIGNSWTSRYSNMPISGLLPEYKDRDR